jgi:hypothetical protein
VYMYIDASTPTTEELYLCMYECMHTHVCIDASIPTTGRVARKIMFVCMYISYNILYHINIYIYIYIYI